LLDSIRRAAPSERIEILEEYLLDEMGRVLRLSPSKIDKYASFTSLGMDSLMGLELRNRLEAGVGLELSATLAYTYSNAASLAQHLSSSLGGVNSESEVSAEGEPAPPAGSAIEESLEDDDLLAALDETMNRAKAKHLV
jgi:acyl carrier protein